MNVVEVGDMRCRIILFAVSFISLSPFALAQLSKEDVVQIIRAELEPIKLQIARIEGRLEAMATKDDIIKIYARMDAMKTELIARMDESDARTTERIDSLYQAVIAMAATIFVAILGAIFGGPMFAEWWRRRQELKAEIRVMKEKARIAMREHPEYAEAYRSIGLIE